MLTILVMFRHKYIGNDTANYIHYFGLFSRMDWSFTGPDSLEIGYMVINKLISLIYNDPHFFLAVIGFAVSAMLYPTYRRLCVDPALTITLFCTMTTFAMLFSGIRQMLAVGIGVIAYEFARKKWLIPFIIAIVVATTIHSSAFVLAFIYPLYHVRITKKIFYYSIPLLVLLFIFNRQIFGFIGSYLERFTRFNISETTTSAYSTLIMILIFTVFAFLIPDDRELDDETIALRNILLFSLILQMFAPVHLLAMRMNYYFIIFIPLLIPKIIEKPRIRFRQVALIARYVMVIFFFVYFFITATPGNKLHIIPYHFFWENYVI